MDKLVRAPAYAVEWGRLSKLSITQLNSGYLSSGTKWFVCRADEITRSKVCKSREYSCGKFLHSLFSFEPQVMARPFNLYQFVFSGY